MAALAPPAKGPQRFPFLVLATTTAAVAAALLLYCKYALSRILAPQACTAAAGRSVRFMVGGRADGGSARPPQPDPARTIRAIESIRQLTKQMPYQSPAARRTVRLKVPWAEPEELDSGFPLRMSQMAADRGLHVDSIAVQRGCVELVLVLQRQRQRSSDGSDSVTSGHPRGASCPRVPCWGLSTADILAALGLTPGNAGRSLADVTRTEYDGAAYGSGPDQGATCSSTGSGLSRQATAPESLVWSAPRVLLLTRSRSGPAAAAEPVPGLVEVTAEGCVSLRVEATAVLPVAGSRSGLAPAAAALPALQVAVRGGGGLVAAHVVPLTAQPRAQAHPAQAHQAHAHRAQAQPPHEYAVVLRGLHAHMPGSLLLDLFCGPAPAAALSPFEHPAPRPAAPSMPRRTLPLVLLSDPEVAVELAAAVAAWPANASERELDELLYDIGAWAAASAAAAAAAAPSEDPAWAQGLYLLSKQGQGQVKDADEDDPQGVWSVLVPHLLGFVEGAGWTALAAALRADLDAHRRRQAQRQRQRHQPDSANQLEALAKLPAAEAEVSGPCPQASPRRQAPVRPWLAALSWVAREAAAPSPEAAAAFGAYAEEWALAVAPTHETGCCGTPVPVCPFPTSRRCPHAPAPVVPLALPPPPPRHVVDVSGFFLVLLAAAAGRTPPADVVMSLVACWASLVCAAARLRLPRPAWCRLVALSVTWRHVSYLASKAMMALRLVPAPPIMRTYTGTPVMLLQEGVIMPITCALTPRSAAAVALAKLPLNALLQLATGTAPSLIAAVLVALRVEAAALAATLALHAAQRLRHQRAGAAGGVAVGLSRPEAALAGTSAGGAAGGSGKKELKTE
ncbi:hypothetical protein HYH03_008599 [Edaphochlamys debaryana]|uniref:Uncharacterized protein n=1 Tax=Edaphochlamys debaryana TaxID=47281 RepID=A0A835Y1Y4_9CHLO|nr:hypothetical protein HYH03_008599 [Edaphochlamys debaryana]|eukprot:KAG2493178.1 hypothetical protein HYH03_008599 [Edaphochlamys debaryana]